MVPQRRYMREEIMNLVQKRLNSEKSRKEVPTNNLHQLDSNGEDNISLCIIYIYIYIYSFTEYSRNRRRCEEEQKNHGETPIYEISSGEE